MMPLVRKAVIAVFLIESLSNPVLGSQMTSPTMRDEVRKLYNTNVKVRNEAALRLKTAGEPARPLLTKVICNRSATHFDIAWPNAARILGELKAASAVPCLVDLLMYAYPSIGPVIMKSDQTLASVDPAFAALVAIGDPAVPELRRRLPFVSLASSVMMLRVLQAIHTPPAREAVQNYIETLNIQTQMANQILRNFGSGGTGTQGQ